jgi:hypothetical protein
VLNDVYMGQEDPSASSTHRFLTPSKMTPEPGLANKAG